MNLLINEQPFVVTMKVLKEKFPEVNFDKPLRFKIRPDRIKEDKDTPGRFTVPKTGVMPWYNKFNKSIGGKETVRYFTHTSEQAIGGVLKKIFYPHNIKFDNDGVITIDTVNGGIGTDLSKVYILLDHPKRMANSGINNPGLYYFFDEDKEADVFNTREQERIEIESMIMSKSNRNYIDDDELSGIARRLSIPGADTFSNSVLRRKILEKAKSDTRLFKANVEGPESAIRELVQEALDMKVILNDGEVFLITYRDETNAEMEKYADTRNPFYKVKPHMMKRPIPDLVTWLASTNGAADHELLLEEVAKERPYLQAHPLIGKRQKLSDFAKKITIKRV